VNELTTAIIGLPKWFSFIPFARHSARAPAILLPSVVVLLLNGIVITYLLYRTLYGSMILWVSAVTAAIQPL
jgi:hypothetical protein